MKRLSNTLWSLATLLLILNLREVGSDCSRIKKWASPILRERCVEVQDFSDIDRILDDLVKVRNNYLLSGISAPQLGDSRRISLVKLDNGLKVLINPRIISEQGYMPSLEACASLPGLIFPKLRRYEIKLEYFTEAGTKTNEIYMGLESVKIQHEIDHLNGRLAYHYFKR